jgi:hypothetical protein
MTRYLMNLRDGAEVLLGPDGVAYESRHTLREAVLRTVRDVMAGDLVRGVIDLRFRIDAEDAAGSIVHTLPFKQAVEIISHAGA